MQTKPLSSAVTLQHGAWAAAAAVAPAGCSESWFKQENSTLCSLLPFPAQQLLQAQASGTPTQAEAPKPQLAAASGRARLTVDSDAADDMQLATFVVPAGEGRMVLLRAPPTARYKVTLSASPRLSLASNGLQQPISAWPTQPKCKGNGLLAAALRQDLAPRDVTRLSSPAIQFSRRAFHVLGSLKHNEKVISLLDYGCNATAMDTDAESASAARREKQASMTYRLPPGMLLLLIDANNTSIDSRGANKVLEGQHQLVGWPKTQGAAQVSQSRAAPGPLLSGASEVLSLPANIPKKELNPLEAAKVTQAQCLRHFHDLHSNPTYSLTLPGLHGQPTRTECGQDVQATLVAYVQNCYEGRGMDLIVQVCIDIEAQDQDICKTPIKRTFNHMCWASLALTLVVMCVCLIPEVVVQLLHRLESRRADRAEKSLKGSSCAMSTNKTGSSAGRSCWAGWAGSKQYVMYHDIFSTLNSPSGYSRWYTITITTSAALLVASIVWAPAVSPSAIHDHGYNDLYIIPRKGIYSVTTEITGAWADNLTYYLKVMLISMCIGHTVKLALLSNLSPPGPQSKGVVVSHVVWRRQVVVSVVGLALLGFCIGTYTLGIACMRDVLVVFEAHWYLLAVMLANFFAALCLYVRYTWLNPPPLTSEAAKQAAMMDAKLARLAGSLGSRNLLAAGWSIQLPTVATSCSKQRSAGAPADHAASGSFALAKDSNATADVRDQGTGIATDLSAAVAKDTGTIASDGAAVVTPGQGTVGKVSQEEAAPEHASKLSLLQKAVEAVQGYGSNVLVAVGKVKDEVWEDDNFRYSAWVLTPVWLTVLLVVFWWLSAVFNTGIVLDCLQDPYTCAGGVLPFVYKLADLQIQAQDFLTSGKEAYLLANKASQDITAKLEALQPFLNLLPDVTGVNVTQLVEQVNEYNKLVEAKLLETERTYDNLTRVHESAEHGLYLAEQVGRWLGYKTATFFALLSLLNIVKTFKRVLLFKIYMKKCSKEQQDMVAELRKTDSTTARFLARVTSGKHEVVNDRVDEDFVRAQLRTTSFPLEDAAAPTSRLRQRHSIPHRVTRALKVPVTASAPQRQYSVSLDLPSHSFDFGSSKPSRTAEFTAGAGSAFASYQGSPLQRTVTFELAPVSSADVSRPVAVQLQPPSSAPEGVACPKSLAEDSVCVAISQDIQRLEVDMAQNGIGESTVLFGVMASVMWIQIRLVGLVLTFVFTLILHPDVWRVTWRKGLWIPVATVIGILLFNLLFIKQFMGNKLLSDGTNIKHRGSWMTFYLMFQFCFMVLGTLYATWRVLLATVMILLFAVAALDRALWAPLRLFGLSMVLDGPYIAFVTSVKLEGAYLAISQRDVEAEQEQEEARQRQQQQQQQQQQQDDRKKHEQAGDAGDMQDDGVQGHQGDRGSTLDQAAGVNSWRA